jgi:hypothetical protein
VIYEWREMATNGRHVLTREQKCNGVQWKALYEYAEMMGWTGRKLKRPKAKPVARRPEMTPDLAARLGLV